MHGHHLGLGFSVFVFYIFLICCVLSSLGYLTYHPWESRLPLPESTLNHLLSILSSYTKSSHFCIHNPLWLLPIRGLNQKTKKFLSHSPSVTFASFCSSSQPWSRMIKPIGSDSSLPRYMSLRCSKLIKQSASRLAKLSTKLRFALFFFKLKLLMQHAHTDKNYFKGCTLEEVTWK